MLVLVKLLLSYLLVISFATFSLIYFSVFFSTEARAGISPKLVPAKFNFGYIPIGFDTNDRVQLVGEGVFASSCFKPGGVKALVDHAKKTIELYPEAYEYDSVCLQMTVPFNKEVDLGLLKAGTYKVFNVTNKDVEELGRLQISVATSSAPDEFLYAPVSQAFFEKRDGRYFITVAGEFPQTCFRMTLVLVRVQANVLFVQPISEQTEDVCDDDPVPYVETVEVQNVKSGRYLLHVRSLNGGAINNLIDVP